MLEPVDFRPVPYAFLIGVETPEELEKKIVLFKPRYESIYRLARDRAAGIDEVVDESIDEL